MWRIGSLTPDSLHVGMRIEYLRPGDDGRSPLHVGLITEMSTSSNGRELVHVDLLNYAPGSREIVYKDELQLWISELRVPFSDVVNNTFRVAGTGPPTSTPIYVPDQLRDSPVGLQTRAELEEVWTPPSEPPPRRGGAASIGVGILLLIGATSALLSIGAGINWGIGALAFLVLGTIGTLLIIRGRDV